MHNLTTLQADLLERAAREANMKGDKMEEEVEELIRVSQSLEVVNQQLFSICGCNYQTETATLYVKMNLEKTNGSSHEEKLVVNRLMLLYR